MIKRTIGISTVDISEAEIDAVTNVLRSKRISPGPVQKEFEKLVAELHGYQLGTLVNSGQSALQLSIEAIKILNPKIKYVVCPATTYISTLHAVWNSNLDVILVDVDYNTFNWSPCLNDLKHFNPNTHILCPVNLMGASANINNCWTDIKHHTNFCIVEDNCESLTAPNTGYGDFMCLSFYAAHQITTGSGGMVCCHNTEYDSLIKSLCNHGRLNSIDLYSATRNTDYDKSKKFVFDKVGFSFKLGDFNAALGLAQAKRINEIITKNINNAKELNKRLCKYDFIKTPEEAGNTFMNYALTCKGTYKQRLVEHLNNWQIETRDLMPILNQPIVIEKLCPNRHQYPNSSMLLDTGFYIGCHGDISAEDIDYIDFVFSIFKY